MKPVRIVGAGFAQVVISVEDGSLYRFEANSSMWSGEPLEGNWSQTLLLETEEFSKCDYAYKDPPAPPSEPLDFLQFGYCPEPIIDVRYAILADGSVWRWTSYRNTNILVPLISVAVGAVVGLLVGIIVWLGLKQKMTDSFLKIFIWLFSNTEKS